VPKFPSIPRLSILIPIGSDLESFERTLISVLENRPAGCEVLVANDGSYDDPFDLGDEVRFVVGSSNQLVDLISAGATESRGRFVQVIADGIQATSGWIDGAIEKFEHHDADAVAPVIRQASTNRIVAAGWQDTDSRLCDAAYRSRKHVNSTSLKLIGAYLQASLWRREILVSMTHAFAGRDVVEASYAYEHLLRSAGWRCVLAAESEMLVDSDHLPWDTTSATRGKRLRAIRSHFNRSGGWAHSMSAATRAMLLNVPRPARLAEALGQALAPMAAFETKRLLRPAVVKSCSEAATILRMPMPDAANRSRRAA
jgi:hypothetical protein